MDTSDLPLLPIQSHTDTTAVTEDIGPCDLLLTEYDSPVEIPNESYEAIIAQRNEWYRNNI